MRTCRPSSEVARDLFTRSAYEQVEECMKRIQSDICLAFLEDSAQIALDTLESLTLRLVDTHSPCTNDRELKVGLSVMFSGVVRW